MLYFIRISLCTIVWTITYNGHDSKIAHDNLREFRLLCNGCPGSRVLADFGLKVCFRKSPVELLLYELRYIASISSSFFSCN